MPSQKAGRRVSPVIYIDETETSDNDAASSHSPSSPAFCTALILRPPSPPSDSCLHGLGDQALATERKMKTARPYRSHKYPACSRCHKRRSRCTIETPGSACLLCRMHGVPCSSESAKRDDRETPKVGFIHRSLLPNAGYVDNMPHVLGPVVARDTQVMENYIGTMSSNDSNDNARQNGMAPSTHQKPVYHVPIPPRRPSPAGQCSCARNMPLDLLNQIEPLFERLVDKYFRDIYPAFPILDIEYFQTHLSDRQYHSKTFLVNFAAFVLYYWNLTSESALHARLDLDSAWSIAVQAVNSSMQQSDMATVVATVFNVAGRPSRAFISNLLNTSRLVTLAHSCGLNHDSREWKITNCQKRLRWKVWWGILIHDRWLSFAHGTPPHINPEHYDVPLPSIELLAGDQINDPSQYRAAECFIELCKLTEILGEVLPLMYHIRSGNENKAAEQTSKSSIMLAKWNSRRPTWANYLEFWSRPPIAGLANLQLSYLAVQMLLRRLAWHESSQDHATSSEWLKSSFEAADYIVRLVRSLTPVDLAGFWLPYHAYHFTSTVTLLLRCALQTDDQNIRRDSMSSARCLVDCLRKLKNDHNWDMAETALDQSEPILKRIEESLPRTRMGQQSAQSRDNLEKINDTFWDNPMLQYPGFGYQGQLEDLFPGVFSELSADSLGSGL